MLQIVRTLYINQVLILWLNLFHKSSAQDLRVMTWNTWLCGLRVNKGYERVETEIINQDPHIVLLQETQTRLFVQRIIRTGTYKECGRRSPFVTTLYKAGNFSEVTSTTEGKYFRQQSTRYHVCALNYTALDAPITVVNFNLDRLFYGPEIGCEIRPKRGGWSIAETIKYYEIQRRTKLLTDVLTPLETISYLADAIVIAGGDLSAPSTPDYQNNGSNPTCTAMNDMVWPTTQVLMERHGLTDVYREQNADVAANAGITYSPVYNDTTSNAAMVTLEYSNVLVTALPTSTTLEQLVCAPFHFRFLLESLSSYPQDRRDFIYYRAGASNAVTLTKAITYYNETGFQTAAQFINSEAIPPRNVWLNNVWPSNHAAVIAEFTLA